MENSHPSQPPPTPLSPPPNETQHERQTLLLMLLAQVCSLHDATPRTFVVHVLALFERGILDGNSIRFLFDLGLVPEVDGVTTLDRSTTEVDDNDDGDDVKDSTKNVVSSQENDDQANSSANDVLTRYFNNSNPLAIVPYCPPQPTKTHPWSASAYDVPTRKNSQFVRSQKSISRESLSRQKEATAIRRQLERHESSSETFREGTSSSSTATTKKPPSSTKYPPTRNNNHNNKPTTTTTQESYTLANTNQTTPNPWSVEQHPLTLSRYQRDFHQIALLATGAFGSVYHSIHKLEGKSYAVKCVTFDNSGYLDGRLAGVVREVRCLALLDHVNCVRYYTSWLEPSWMTGESNLSKPTYDDDYFESHTNNNDRPKLLTDIEQVVNGIHKSDEIDDTVEKLEALLYGGGDDGFDWATNSKRTQADGFDWVDSSKEQSESAVSFDNRRKVGGWTANETKNQSARSFESVDDIEDSDVSEWTRELDANESHGSQWDSKYSTFDHDKTNRDRSESFHEVHSSMHGYAKKESFELVKADHKPHPKRDDAKPNRNRRASTPTSSYKYQICLFIQMQLCRPTTLSDWIKQRNHDCVHFDVEVKQKRARPAFIIFRQIVNGLEHVHSKGIIHRDLKPANIFASDNGNWCIGDFGLSKMMRDAHPVPLSPNSDEFFPSSRNAFTDGHTRGVGTASYAAPEQITENDYGPEVDIFALGIILLELFSNFTSEHERASAFHNLRHHRELEPWMHRSYPEVASLVLACTHTDRRKRPTATDILKASVFHDEISCTELYRVEVKALKDEIDRRDDLIERQRDLLKKRDQEIEELRQRLERVEAIKGGVCNRNQNDGGSSSYSSLGDY